MYLYRESTRTVAVVIVVVAVAFCCVDTVAVICCVVVLNARAASLRLRAVVEFCVVSLGDECRVAIIFHAPFALVDFDSCFQRLIALVDFDSCFQRLIDLTDRL